jgi:ankyrin repeat protein
MKSKVMLLVAASMLFPRSALCGQGSVCELFSHLAEGADGRQVILTGDLIISKDLAAIGAADCDNQYISNHYIWPTGLSLRPSPDITPEGLQQFREAATKADNLRRAGKIVSASGSFSGRLRMVPSGGYPGELVFDFLENLSVEALPDPSTLPVIPICDLFQNLSAWKGKRIAVRGELVGTMEGTWISGRCKGGFVTNGYRWPVFLTFGGPAYYSSETGKLQETKWPAVPEGEEALEGRFSVVKTATFVGLLRMRSEYTALCRPDGTYLGNGFGHLNGAAAELLVDSVLNLDLTRPPASEATDDDEPERCTPPNLPALCASAQTMAQAASLGCVDRVRELLAKNGIDTKDGSESRSLDNAIRSGHEAIVKLLIQAGAPLNPERPAVMPPLFEAAFFRRIAILKRLLTSGAQVDGLDSQGGTYLVSYGFFDSGIMKILLEAGANPNKTDRDGQTAIMHAASYGYEESVRILIEHHAEMNLRDHEGRTALMHAAMGGYVDAIPLLLENGADPNARDSEGKTALDLALISKHQAAVKLLSAVKK